MTWAERAISRRLPSGRDGQKLIGEHAGNHRFTDRTARMPTQGSWRPWSRFPFGTETIDPSRGCKIEDVG